MVVAIVDTGVVVVIIGLDEVVVVAVCAHADFGVIIFVGLVVVVIGVLLLIVVVSTDVIAVGF